MSDSEFDQDELVLQELKSQKLDGLTPRAKMAIKELANRDQGAMIFLIVGLNKRIKELEESMSSLRFNEETT